MTIDRRLATLLLAAFCGVMAFFLSWGLDTNVPLSVGTGMAVSLIILVTVANASKDDDDDED
jgi:hypothetical protein